MAHQRILRALAGRGLPHAPRGDRAPLAPFRHRTDGRAQGRPTRRATSCSRASTKARPISAPARSAPARCSWSSSIPLEMSPDTKPTSSCPLWSN
jgi:hypothetical protein